MDGISILWRPNSIYSDQTCRSSVGGYCDHQENRKSVIGRDHSRVPSGVPLPAASGLSAASGQHAPCAYLAQPYSAILVPLKDASQPERPAAGDAAFFDS